VSTLRPDIASLPDLLHGRSRSGPVRERRPVYVDLLPPCNAGCPAGENIQSWLAMQTVFTTDHHAVRATPGDVYGVISLVFWSIPFLRAPRRSLCAHAVTTRVPRKRASRQACVLDLKAPGL
jgi:hypothetical protein